MPDRATKPGRCGHSRNVCPAPALLFEAEFILSHRQREVLSLAALGYTDKAIALQLNVSRRTVGAHLQSVRDELGAVNTTHAVALAISFGLIGTVTVNRPRE